MRVVIELVGMTSDVILTIILATLTSIVTFLLLYAVARTIGIYLVHRKFKKDAKGLPMMQFQWSPGGNMSNILFGTYSILKIEPLSRKYNAKTGGGMFGMQKFVCTIDRELINIINFTEANKHYNQGDRFNVPAEELEKDTIFNAKDEQWRRIRRSVAPAFT